MLLPHSRTVLAALFATSFMSSLTLDKQTESYVRVLLQHPLNVLENQILALNLFVTQNSHCLLTPFIRLQLLPVFESLCKVSHVLQD